MPFDPKDRRPAVRVTADPKATRQTTPSTNTGSTGAADFTDVGAPPPSTAIGRSQIQADTTELDALRQERLASALKAIGINFDIQETGFRNEIRDLKGLFDTSILQNQRDVTDTTQNTEDAFIERGIFRSGIHAQQLARNLQPLATERATLLGQLNPVEGDEGTQVRDLLSAIGLLAPAEASAEAAARLEAEQSRLETEQMIALITAGLR